MLLQEHSHSESKALEGAASITKKKKTRDISYTYEKMKRV